MALQTTTIKTQINATVSGGVAPVANQSVVNDVRTDTFAPGNSAGLASVLYAAARTVSSGSPDAILVSSLTDPQGNAINFANVDAIIVTNLSVTAGQILTVGAGTHPVGGSLAVPLPPGTASLAGGRFCWDCPAGGFVVAGGSADVLTVTAAAGSNVPYSIELLGRHA